MRELTPEQEAEIRQRAKIGTALTAPGVRLLLREIDRLRAEVERLHQEAEHPFDASEFALLRADAERLAGALRIAVALAEANEDDEGWAEIATRGRAALRQHDERVK